MIERRRHRSDVHRIRDANFVVWKLFVIPNGNMEIILNVWVEKLVLGTQFNTIDAKAEHEGGCEGRNAANVFITLDGKAKFLCKVAVFQM